MKTAFANGLGAFKSSARSSNEITLTYENEKIRIEFLKEDLFRLKISQAGIFGVRGVSCCFSLRRPSLTIFLYRSMRMESQPLA